MLSPIIFGMEDYLRITQVIATIENAITTDAQNGGDS